MNVGASATPARTQWPSLITALTIMAGGVAYPLLMADRTGHADHGLAMVLLWGMSAGFVRGVGFVPRSLVWRSLLSGWACAAALGIALALKLLH